MTLLLIRARSQSLYAHCSQRVRREYTQLEGVRCEFVETRFSSVTSTLRARSGFV